MALFLGLLQSFQISISFFSLLSWDLARRLAAYTKAQLFLERTDISKKSKEEHRFRRGWRNIGMLCDNRMNQFSRITPASSGAQFPNSGISGEQVRPDRIGPPAALSLDILESKKSSSTAVGTASRVTQVQYEANLGRLQAYVDAEKDLSLQKGSGSFLLAHRRPPKRGTVILLHGWTSGTWQIQPVAQKLFEAGFNVFAPRLVGHGFQNEEGMSDPSHLPTGSEEQSYREFVSVLGGHLDDCSGPVSVMGFSGGAVAGLELASENDAVTRAVLVAPFLRPANPAAQTVSSLCAAIDPWVFGLGSRLLNNIDHCISDAGTASGIARGKFGHGTVSLGNVHALVKYGNSVLEQAKNLSTPIQVIASEKDGTSELAAILEMYAGLKPSKANGSFIFPEQDNVPHCMVNPDDVGCPVEITDKVASVALDFLAEGRPSHKMGTGSEEQ